MAQALETNPSLLREVVGNLSAETGQRMAEATNDAVAIAESEGRKSLMQVLMENMAPATAQALAEGLNQSAAQNPGFLTALLVNLDEETGKAVGRGLNAMAVGEGSSAFFQVLDITLGSTQAHTLSAITGALETPQGKAFLNALLSNLDAAALGAGVNAGIDAAPSHFLRNNLAATDADMMARITRGVGMDLARDLLGLNPNPSPLDASLVADALAGGIQPLLEGLLSELDAEGTASEMRDIVNLTSTYSYDPVTGLNTRSYESPPGVEAFDLLTDMMADNDALAQVLADAITNSINSDTDSSGLLHNLGIKVRLRFYGSLLGIPIGLDLPGTGYVDGAYTGRLRHAVTGE